ncbi:hypothetical protein JOC78_000892 [Bacillus ectoiniformans]|uniref:YppG family protein n=1 Tax=Bacillus ectoiniformans TaxID=1494429 RepID=UPI00195B724F|nr:YppG family protein [Bacillus ectoiniformans]MBM7647952.1 hypothetical protein [Bacillus ectoiniformans]
MQYWEDVYRRPDLYYYQQPVLPRTRNYGPLPMNGYPPIPNYPSYTSGMYDHPLYKMEPVKQEPFYSYYPAAPQAPYPYPTQVMGNKPSMVMQSFKNDDGSFNISKAIDTAGMMVNTVNQFSGMLKGITGFFKA